MELWIRSQDREELVKAERITFIHNTFNCETINYRMLADNVHIGSYATKERALEVLDDIQNIILLKDMYSHERDVISKAWENQNEEDIKNIRKQMAVYEMPED